MCAHMRKRLKNVHALPHLAFGLVRERALTIVRLPHLEGQTRPPEGLSWGKTTTVSSTNSSGM